MVIFYGNECMGCRKALAADDYWPYCGPECYDKGLTEFADAGGFDDLERVADAEAKKGE